MAFVTGYFSAETQTSVQYGQSMQASINMQAAGLEEGFNVRFCLRAAVGQQHLSAGFTEAKARAPVTQVAFRLFGSLLKRRAAVVDAHGSATMPALMRQEVSKFVVWPVELD